MTKYYVTRRDLEEDPDISIVVERESEKKLRIHINRKRYFSSLTPKKVNALAKDLTKAADRLVSDVKAGLARKDWSVSLLNTQHGLASIGFATKQEFFSGALNPVFLEAIVKKSRNPALVFHICCDGEQMPWSLLFETPPVLMANASSDITSKEFWSLKHIISQRFLEERNIKNADEAITPNIIDKGEIRIGVIIEKNLKYAKQEYKALKKLVKELPFPVRLELFKHKKNITASTFIEEMNAFLSKDFDILHLACHAQPKQDPRASQLIVCDRQPYLLRYLTQGSKPVEIKAPVIFLNACESSIRDFAQTYTFVSELFDKGARNIIAIEAAIQSEVAEHLAVAFYKNLLHGMKLGLALHQAKQELIDSGTSAADIYSIFYSLYGSESFKLIEEMAGTL